MYFILHHSTGTLLLDAQDRMAVVSWTERQLGNAAKRAAVIEIEHDVTPDWVEKSGTGVIRSGCEAFLSVMADSVQRVTGIESSPLNCQESVLTHEVRTQRSSVH